GFLQAQIDLHDLAWLACHGCCFWGSVPNRYLPYVASPGRSRQRGSTGPELVHHVERRRHFSGLPEPAACGFNMTSTVDRAAPPFLGDANEDEDRPAAP